MSNSAGRRKLFAPSVALIALSLVSACGGGGGGGGGGGAASVPAAIGALPGGTVGGKVTFDSVPNTSGPLDYAATTAKPVRGALVELVSDAQKTVLASGTTDDEGNYRLAAAPGQAVFVRVKAALRQAGAGASWDVSVLDNTRGNALYAMETGVFTSGEDGGRRDVHAPSGWSGSGYAGQRVAAPFAILDTIYNAQRKVQSAVPNANFPLLRVFWSVNNAPGASGNPALGQIGTTYFTRTASEFSIYVLGKANADSDEYDDSVIAHEWGHYYQAVFSRDDSVGGVHGPVDRLDRRVAFSEGWANAWSGIVLARSNYTDSLEGQAGFTNIDLSTGPASGKGWFSEASIHYVLWTLNQRVGFKSIHDAMAGPMKSWVAVTAIHPFHASLSSVAPAAAAQLAPLLAAEQISNAADPWGSAESNNGGLPLALPLYRQLTVGAPLSDVCVSNSFGTDNKLGNYAYVRFAVPTARTYQIQVSGGPGASNPDFRVYNGAGLLVKATATTPASESSSATLPAGEYVLALNDQNHSAASTCFGVSVN